MHFLLFREVSDLSSEESVRRMVDTGKQSPQSMLQSWQQQTQTVVVPGVQHTHRHRLWWYLEYNIHTDTDCGGTWSPTYTQTQTVVVPGVQHTHRHRLWWYLESNIHTDTDCGGTWSPTYTQTQTVVVPGVQHTHRHRLWWYLESNIHTDTDTAHPKEGLCTTKEWET